ncbi:unnamed protein product [Hymenolepis diminuta]|uniref:Uncharacterized protein n=1 Tax=Hymenolepis diminuta TaxID=6216 RepID=A0A564Z8U2_HYMDI|nr:unnamed protein product [Hymenolepis diminuta]
MECRLRLLCSSLSSDSSLLGCRCLSVHKFLLLFCSVLRLPAKIGSSRDSSLLSSWSCSMSNYVAELSSMEDMLYVLCESGVSDSVSDPIVSLMMGLKLRFCLVGLSPFRIAALMHQTTMF